MITAIARLVNHQISTIGFRLLDDDTGRTKDVHYTEIVKKNVEISNLLVRDGKIGVRYPTREKNLQ